MNRIYISMILTALMSFFLLGELIGLIFEVRGKGYEREEFLFQQKLIDGFTEQLSEAHKGELESKVKVLSSRYQIDLSLELIKNISLPTELNKIESVSDGLLLESDDGIYLVKSIEGHPEYLLELLLQNRELKKSNFEVWLNIIFYIGFCLLLILWAFPLTRRLAKLDRMALKFGLGGFDERVKLSRFSYIEQLEKSFNRMADQIEDLLVENKLLAGSISHDLRTPLSCLRFGVDAAMENNKQDSKDYYLSRINEDLSRMEVMLDAFLDYARMDRKGFELSKNKIDLNQLVLEVVKECMPLAENKRRELMFQCDGSDQVLAANVDALWVKRAVTNLVDNAVKFSKKTVKISCFCINKKVIVSVEDDGLGVPDGETCNIFKAFFQLDKSRTNREGNFGLGLAIVSRVASWHEGEITVSSSDTLGGARFDMALSIA